jgi:hypothetical protein
MRWVLFAGNSDHIDCLCALRQVLIVLSTIRLLGSQSEQYLGHPTEFTFNLRSLKITTHCQAVEFPIQNPRVERASGISGGRARHNTTHPTDLQIFCHGNPESLHHFWPHFFGCNERSRRSLFRPSAAPRHRALRDDSRTSQRPTDR